ncbi:MAG: DUF5667 domain-containing protein [Patescibacteria group bacterium]|nr:DUF5667 domain-containing protein [Patescibacteria group bacterium]MDD5294630.1 DUF5667 domain-containing protein [Patescibacteria group bacterium]MDD5554394.1 DUF5667 domain-containing protein [Patescibacteria group bacterium]
MENKELIEKLNSLKSMAPDREWKEKNRAILFSQISATVVPAAKENGAMVKIFVLPRTLARFFSTPAWAVFFVCLLIVAGSAFSVGAARLTKPDSSLYIARIISEKAQLAVTFGEEKKAKLSFKFANDHAKDITEILAKTDSGDEAGKSKTEKLSENFKNEMKVAKTKLKEMGAAPSKTEGGSEEDKVFSANLGREERGVQVSEPQKEEIVAESNQTETGEVGIIKTEGAEKATNTPAKEAGGHPADLGDAHKILEEAEELFNEKDYGGTLNKLEEANNIVNNVGLEDRGEVKGASDGATSTEEYKVEK